MWAGNEFQLLTTRHSKEEPNSDFCFRAQLVKFNNYVDL